MITIRELMTPVPVCTLASTSVTTAHAMLRDHHIRHLPVIGPSGNLLGLVTDRDLALTLAMNLHARDVKVADVMRRDVFTVEADARLDEVAAEMAIGKHGEAVVVEHLRVIGIFTTVDVCHALVTVLHAARS